jgi:amino acid adenylation domain-containing protein
MHVDVEHYQLNDTAIAIIGMAGRFPGARNLTEFWQNLRNGKESITFFSEQELLDQHVDPDLVHHPQYVKASGVLDAIDLFDASFFGFSPREAQVMDPQQRIFLECAWEALENAGYNALPYQHPIGVYAGTSMSGYLLQNLWPNQALLDTVGRYQVLMGNGGDFLTTRVSYQLHLDGPSMAVQTGCSSSLVAVHLACQSLLSGECTLALAGGVSVLVPQKVGYLYQEGAVFSPDGHCRAFDAQAQGTVPGSGVGIVVLKRLEEALADRDQIYAVIRGSALNNDGARKVGYTAPSIQGQARVIREALALAEVDPASLSYLEAHGTGTPLGDPIELAALHLALGDAPRSRPCALGSVKSNIGHLDAAAGIAGLIKTALALWHRELPPTLHVQTPTPAFDWQHSPLELLTTLRPWEPMPGAPRRAGVSSFGIGGTNAHVVLEEAPAVHAAPALHEPAPAHLLVLSGRSARVLEQQSDGLAHWLGQPAHAARLADAAWTLQVGRQAFAHRRLVVGSRAPELAEVLARREPSRVLSGVCPDQDTPPVLWLFPGQGIELLEQGRGLYEQEPHFRASLQHCTQLLQGKLALDLPQLLYPQSEAARAQARLLLTETRQAQPVLFALEYALAQMWRSWGIEPAAVVGHSLGEYVAATVAGILDLEDALDLVVERGRLMQERVQPGGMLAVPLGEQELSELLEQEPRVSLAAVNGPGQCVLAGSEEGLQACERWLASRGEEGQRLATRRAFHSWMVEPILREFEQRVRGVRMREGRVRSMANVTGEWMSAEQRASGQYWVEQMRQPVRFGQGLRRALAAGPCLVLEIGPGRTLSSLVRRQGLETDQLPRGIFTSLPTKSAASAQATQEHATDYETALLTLGRLWLAGVPVNWEQVHAGRAPHRISLPSAPFDRQRYWIDPPIRIGTPQEGQPGTPGLMQSEQAINEDENPPPQLSEGEARRTLAPVTPQERLLARLWQELLGLEAVGLDDNFFELGGHSLLAIQLAARLRSRLNTEISLGQLLAAATLREQALLLVQAKNAHILAAAPQSTLPMLFHDPEVRSAPLSAAQQRVWFLHQLTPHQGLYNMRIYARLHGSLMVSAFQQSLRTIVQRHAIFRTTYQGQQSHLRQLIAPVGSVHNWPLPVIDLQTLSQEEQAREVQRLSEREARRPFDLEHGPILRTSLLRIAPQEHVLLLTVHHIAFDGWSQGVFLQELAHCYNALCEQRPPALPPLALQYTDYARWQDAYLTSASGAEELRYWKEQLAGAPTVITLPTDRPRPLVQSYRGESVRKVLPSSLALALRRLSQQEDATLFMTLLAAFQVLLSRYSRQTDLLVGTPIANRTHRETEPLIGIFINTLVLRTNLAGTPSFRELLGRVRKVALEGYSHQHLPFERLVGELQPERSLSHNPLFQVMFALQDALPPVPDLQGLSFSPLPVKTGATEFDLYLLMRDTEEGLVCVLEYSPDLFDEETAWRMLGHFSILLDQIAQNPDASIASLLLLSVHEQHQTLVEWNATSRAFPQVCVHQLFEAQCEQCPDAIAVVYSEEHLTYAELNRRANQLAHFLQTFGVGPETLVGICMERSLEMVIGVLGILKAGGAYLPIDPAYPKERIEFMLADAQAPVLLTQQRLEDRLPVLQARTVFLDSDWERIDRQESTNPQSGVQPGNIAYVMYTSGSTGRPKGTLVLHSALVNVLNWQRRTPGLTDKDIFLAVTTLSFDIATVELLLPLLVGAHLTVVGNEISSREQLLEKLVTCGATVMQATPTTWRLLVEVGRPEHFHLTIICGGEAFPPDLAKHLLPPAVALWNIYGPTETTIWSSSYQITCAEDTVPIGHPLDNTEIYLLDEMLAPVPIGVPGELYIGGSGLARGYLNRPELTAERFIPHPFSQRPGERLYRTGDLACYRRDGTIEYLGRIDNQVKIRGVRIELKEIETVLLQHPAVRECVAAQKEVASHQRLVAYILANDEQAPRTLTNELRDYLQKKLPFYMVPSSIVLLQKFPLTPNGKVDRRALPIPSEVLTAEGYHAPLTRLEQTIAALWEEILQVEKVGRDDNFFDLGGYSLLLFQIHDRLLQLVDRDISILELFLHPTVHSLARYILEEGEEDHIMREVEQRAKQQREALTQRDE